MCIGDFRGAPDPREVADRRPVEVRPETFAAVMRSHEIEVRFEVPDVIGGAAPLAVALRPRRLADLEPEAIAEQVPALQKLLAVRNGLTSIKGPLGGEKAFRNAIQKRLSDPHSRARLRREIGLPDEDERDAALRARIAAAIGAAASTTSERQLAELAQHPSAPVRQKVVENVHTPIVTLLALGAELPWQVCRAVARRATEITVSVYRRLPVEARAYVVLPVLGEAFHDAAARSTDADVRGEIARVASSPWVLARLAEDPVEDVRWAAGNNAAATRAVRKRVHALRPAGSERHYRFARPERPLAEMSFEEVLALLRAPELQVWSDVVHLAERALTATQRAVMVSDPCVVVRRALAMSRGCDDATLRRMVEGADEHLARDIATSPRVSAETRAALARHPDERVRRAVATR